MSYKYNILKIMYNFSSQILIFRLKYHDFMRNNLLIHVEKLCQMFDFQTNCFTPKSVYT